MADDSALRVFLMTFTDSEATLDLRIASSADLKLLVGSSTVLPISSKVMKASSKISRAILSNPNFYEGKAILAANEAGITPMVTLSDDPVGMTYLCAYLHKRFDMFSDFKGGRSLRAFVETAHKYMCLNIKPYGSANRTTLDDPGSRVNLMCLDVVVTQGDTICRTVLDHLPGNRTILRYVPSYRSILQSYEKEDLVDLMHMAYFLDENIEFMRITSHLVRSDISSFEEADYLKGIGFYNEQRRTKARQILRQRTAPLIDWLMDILKPDRRTLRQAAIRVRQRRRNQSHNQHTEALACECAMAMISAFEDPDADLHELWSATEDALAAARGAFSAKHDCIACNFIGSSGFIGYLELVLKARVFTGLCMDCFNGGRCGKRMRDDFELCKRRVFCTSEYSV